MASYSQIENGVGMTRFLIEQWNRSKRKLPTSLPEARRVTLVTSIMAQPVIEQLAEDIRQVEQLEVQVLPVVNKFFGAEVTVAGLLCGQDVLAALRRERQFRRPCPAAPCNVRQRGRALPGRYDAG